MMRYFVLSCALVFFLALTLASSLPRETPFIVALAGFFALPLRGALLFAIIAGALVDVFSPIKGLSALAYALGIGTAALLHRHMLTNHSLLAFVLLAFISSGAVFAVKAIGMTVVSLLGADAGARSIFSIDAAFRIFRSAGLNLIMFIVLYGILRNYALSRHL